MSLPTLFQLAGREPRPPVLAEAVLVLIDHQNEYLDGPLRLPGAEAAVAQAARVEARADCAPRQGQDIGQGVQRGGSGR